MPAPHPALAPFQRQWAARLTTFRRDGTPVGTAVNVAVEGDRAYVRTFERAWKLRRIQNNPLVELAPSDWRGRPTGPSIRARARILEGAESESAGRRVSAKHPIFQGLLVRLGHRLLRYRTMHLELTPADTEATR